MADAYASLPPIAEGGAAVITGGASGIGFAAAKRFAGLGLPVVIADLPGDGLKAAEAELAAIGQALAVPTDVADPAALERLRDLVLDRFGHVSILMNNAGAAIPAGKPWTDLAGWRRTLDTNFWGVVHGVQAFVPGMLEAGRPAYVINTGSKQGITLPPGNAPYNVSKAALKAFTESLQHDLRNTSDGVLSAHLLVPGFTFTGIIAKRLKDKPPGAWSPEQVVEFMLAALQQGDFYILCPDNETTREMDERRIQWAADDLVRNRPALSRWHAGFADEFARWMKPPS